MQRRHLAALVRRVGFTEEQPSAQKSKASRYKGEIYNFGTSRGHLRLFEGDFPDTEHQELPGA